MPTLKIHAVVFRAAVLAGVVVGLIDGVQAAVRGSVSAGFVACVALTFGFDLLAAWLGGAALALLVWLAGWGRRRKSGLLAASAGWLVAGGCAAGAAVAAVTGTANRNNRFLAAGVVVLASLATAFAAAFIGPAMARLVRFGRAPEATPRSVSFAGVLVLAPLLALVLEAAVFLVVWRVRAPLRKEVLFQRSLSAALLSASVPFVLAWASARLGRIRPWLAVLMATLLFGVPVALLVRARWAQDFQFLPWTMVAVIAGLVVGTVALSFVLRGRPASRRRFFALLALPLVALVVVLGASESEPARKAASAHAGFAGHLVALGQQVTDFDHDGYARFFGGGDCDDRDPERNPGARDWPDDGIDQDCDGKDATVAALRSPPFQPVPDAVPADLKILLVTIDTLRADHLGCYGYSRPT